MRIGTRLVLNSSLALISWIALSSPLLADFIRVSQRAETAGAYNTGTYTVLGNINVFTAGPGVTLAQYYSYGTVGGQPSGNPIAPLLSADTSHIFFVQASDGLGLFMIHGKRDGASQGNNVQMLFHYDASATASFLVKDDPGETYKVNGSTAITSGNQFETTHNWDNNTDGAVIGSLTTSWTMYASFQNIGANSNLINWKTYSSDGSSIALDKDNNQFARFDFISVPVPQGAVMAGIGVISLMVLNWKRRKTPTLA